MYAIRHGEVMLMPVSKLPSKKIEKHVKYVVGHSETGHHHVLESEKEFGVMLDRAMLYIQLFEPANLVHQKSANAHKTLVVPKGTYKIIHKSEYDPFAKVKRPVFD